MSRLVVTSYGAYLPRNKVPRSEMTAAFGLGQLSGGRTAASFDEDSTTMAVESIRGAGRPPTDTGALAFVTGSPVYGERSNSAIIHATLDLPSHTGAADSVGNAQTAVTTLQYLLSTDRPAVVVASDVRDGLPGGAFEWYGCDAAATIGLAPDGTAPTVAEFLGGSTHVLPLGDTWTATDEPEPRTWDTRFSSHVLVPIAIQLSTELLDQYGGGGAEVGFVVSASNRRVRSDIIRIATKQGWTYRGEILDDLGYAGAADPLLAMAAAFESTPPGSELLVLTVADGVTGQLWRTGPGVGSSPSQAVAAQVEQRHDTSYSTYLRWRGRLNEESPRRPEPDRVSAPAAFRNKRWKYALVGGDCTKCGGRNVPAQRICTYCRQPADMVPVELQTVHGTVRSATMDHLAYAKGDKVVAAIVDLDGGGRLASEVADAHGLVPKPGDRVVPTFRRISARDGVHNYFWKVRPVSNEVNS